MSVYGKYLQKMCQLFEAEERSSSSREHQSFEALREDLMRIVLPRESSSPGEKIIHLSRSLRAVLGALKELSEQCDMQLKFTGEFLAGIEPPEDETAREACDLLKKGIEEHLESLQQLNGALQCIDPDTIRSVEERAQAGEKKLSSAEKKVALIKQENPLEA